MINGFEQIEQSNIYPYMMLFCLTFDKRLKMIN